MRILIPPQEFLVGDRLVLSQSPGDLSSPIVLVYEEGFAWDTTMLFEFDEVDPGPYMIERELEPILRDLVRVLQ